MAVGLVVLTVLMAVALMCLCVLWCRMRKLKVGVDEKVSESQTNSEPCSR